MEFKLEGKVKLVENGTALLKKILEYLDYAGSELLPMNIANKLTDEQYHEICHQGYLYQLEDKDGDDDLFCKDNGKLHNRRLENYEDVIKSNYKHRMKELADPEYRYVYLKTDVDYERRKAKREYEQGMDDLMKEYKFELMIVILESTLGWNIFCSTLNALKKNNNETDDDGILYRVDQ